MSDVNWLAWEALMRGGYNCKTERDIAIDDSIAEFMAGIIDDPAYQADAQINGELNPLIISRKSTIKAQLKALPDTNIHIGDLVTCFDEQWLVVELYYDSVGMVNGTLWLCNKTINFQNFSPTIHTKYCIVDDGTYSKQSTDPDVYIMTNTYKLFISIDENSQLLYVDKRLGLDKIISSDNKEILEVYKIIGIDRLSRNFGEGSHLMVVTLQRDVYDAEHDDITNLICDVYEDDSPIEPVGDKFIRFLGKTTLRIGSKSRIGVQFVSDGQIMTGVNAVWSVTVPEGSKVTYTDSNNILTLRAPLSENEIGNEITIIVSDSNNNYPANTMKVKVIALG